jgi:hypothetical protein
MKRNNPVGSISREAVGLETSVAFRMNNALCVLLLLRINRLGVGKTRQGRLLRQ